MKNIGNTPFERIDFLSSPTKNVWGKFEFKNPTGSHKDRAYLSMIEGLEKTGELKRGMTLIDYTSGDGGAALARLVKEKGYFATVVIPSQMSRDKIRQIKDYGAKIIVIPSHAKYGYYGPEDLMRARIEAARIAHKNPQKFIFLDQGENPLNKEAFLQLGKEIVKQCEEKNIVPDIFVCGIGTGGTLSGTAKTLREKYGNSIKVIGVEPFESSTIYAKKLGQKAEHAEHNLSGLGMGTREANLDISLIDSVILVKNSEWLEMLKTSNKNGLPIGKSSAAGLVAVKKAFEMYPDAKNIITIFFDGIEKYKSEHLLEKDLEEIQVDSNKIEKRYEATWDTLFQDPLFHLRTAFDPEMGRILKSLRTAKTKKILSMPCGDFYNEVFLAKRGFKIEGVDISREAIRLSRKKIKNENLKNCSVKQADFFKSTFLKKYDAVLALDITMHLSDISVIEFLQKSGEVLLPNGLLFINFLSPEDDTYEMGDVVDTKTRMVFNREILIHYREKFEIEELFLASQFKIQSIKPYKRTDKVHHKFRGENKKTHTHRGHMIIARKKLSSVEEALLDSRKGKPIIVIDHREQEGDFFIPSEKITASAVNFMLAHGRGILCVSLLSERFKELGLLSPSTTSIGYNETRFGDPVDYLIGTTTGVSAHDRAATIHALTKNKTKKADLRTPGHVRTLEALSDGLKVRSGHTEASIELAKLAKCYPSGALIEILKENGEMAREKDLIKLSKKLEIKIIRINQIKFLLYGKI